MKCKLLRFAATSSMCLFLAATLQAQVSFFAPPEYSGSGNVFVADFNGDGIPDVLTSYASAGSTTLNLVNGDGTIKQTIFVPGSPFAVADFNGDGKPDLLEEDFGGSGALLVLLGNGDGTFQSPINTPTNGYFFNVFPFTLLTVADLNADGKPDVVGVSRTTVSNHPVLIVYIGQGDGTFAPGVSYNAGDLGPVVGGGSFQATQLSFGDFNGDNKTDVVVSVAAYDGSGKGSGGQEIVLLGNGDGTLQGGKTSAGVFYPAYAAVGDFNGDGKLDIAISAQEACNGSCTAGSVYILFGNGDGTFQSPKAEIPGNGPIAAVDLNDDGKLDLIVEGDPTVAQIYLGNGDGSFSNASNYVLFLNSPTYDPLFSGIATADFNLDGKLDIALGNFLLLGNENGTFRGIQFGTVPGNAGADVVGGFDKNSAPGVALLSNQQIGSNYVYNVCILHNNGSGALSLTHTYALQEPGFGIAQADLNHDGNLDLVVFGTDPVSQKWSYSVLLGNGDGSFQSPVYYPQNVVTGIGNIPSIVLADFNNDQTPDLGISLGGTNGNGSLAFLLGNGDGTFAAPAYLFDGGASYLVSADFDSDGKLDIAAGGSAGTVLLLGNGDGTFQPAVIPPGLGSFPAQFSADLNNDGKPDLLSNDQVALGKGDGTFTLLPALSTPPGLTYNINQVADLNGDGKPDLLVTYDLAGWILLGNGDGTFGSLTVMGSGSILPSNAIVADMNDDSRPDIIFPWQFNKGLTTLGEFAVGVSGVAVMLNNTSPGFQLIASALSPSNVNGGNSASSDVNSIRSFGFAGTITLSCTGLPNGATCQFNPPSLPSGLNTSSLTIVTSSGAAGGTYPVQVQGSSGSLTSSTTLSLVIQAPPDFELSVPTNSQTVSAGQAANFTVGIMPLESFTGTVNLGCTITPTVTRAPTCTLSSSSVQITASGAQSFTVAVGTTAPMTTMTLPYFGFPTALIPMTWGVILLGLGLLHRRNRKYQPIAARSLITAAFSLCIGCGGCTSGPPSHTTPGTPTGTYSLTVTATSGSLSHNTTLQAIVQ